MKNKFIILAIVLVLPAIWWFFGSGYYNMHDDLQVMRIYQMEKCFMDGQIPCRWVPDMAYGYGQALFNFYSAFPYYTGIIIRILTPLSIIGTIKALFALSLLGGAVGMYFLAKEFWGHRGGLISAILYTYAPYRALDVYVRGALAESFALAIYPFLWLYFYRLIKYGGYKNIAGVSLSLMALLTTHNISTMIFTPLTLLWVLGWIVVSRNWRAIISVAAAGFLGVGLASFFILPALFEQNIIQTQYLTQGYSDYRGHFVTLNQLFVDRSWGDGPSIFGPNENISFQIGWPHWWLVIPGVLAVFYLIFNRQKKALGLLALAFFMFAGFFTFLTHSKSIYVWEAVPIMSFIQFPWRFLGLTVFFLSLGGGVIALLPKFKTLGVLVVTSLTIILNYNYFIPVNYSRLVTDNEKLTGVAFELQQKAAILDYLPKTAKKAPESVAFEMPKTISGSAVVKNFDKGSNRFSFDVEAYTETQIEVPVMYFPGWTLLVNDKERSPEIHGDYGLIKLSLDEGIYQIRGIFKDTPIRTFGNTLTLLSGGALLAAGALSRKRNE